jgi:hypothetical protein
VRAICLFLPCVVAVALFAYPGGGADPHHVHIVVGGTPAERAKALALHLLQERNGIDGERPPAVPAYARPAAHTRTGARVLSIRQNGDGGLAVLTIDRSGFVVLAAVPCVPAASSRSRVASATPLRITHAVRFNPDPPPRRAPAGSRV